VALRAALILGMVGLAVGVWAETWIAVRAKSAAELEWHRVTGTVIGLAHPTRPDIKVEQGIEFVPPPTDVPEAYEADERVLEMESDEGLRRFRRYEFLVDPVTHRARLAGMSYSPILLGLLGLVYLGLAGAFYVVTKDSLAYQGATLPVSPPEGWMNFQSPSWHEPAIVAARYSAWPVIEKGLGAAIGIFGFVMLWTWREGSLLRRVGLSSVALFVGGVFAVYTLSLATYRIEADSTGLRESSALGWRMTPWPALRGAVDETVHYASRTFSRRSFTPGHTTHRVFFTDDQGEEIVSIGDDFNPQQAQALVAHILSRTGLHLEKRVRNEK
jgi:hypothetical protein